MPRFEIQHDTFCDSWINTWTDDNENPVTFETREEAQKALEEYFQDIDEAVAAGDMLAYDRKDFRIVEII